ncbi:MAG: fatty acid desaturase [Sandaracinaceae bacterium]
MPTEEPARRWHVRRAQRIVRDHPTVKGLVGPDPRTAAVILGLAGLHYAVAWACRDMPWYLALIPAYLVGIIIAHALAVAIHDCAHDLVFRPRWANKLISIVANVPLMFPAAIDFRHKHLEHHRHLGEERGRDTQMPTGAEARWAGRSPLRKALWLTFGPVVVHATSGPEGHRRRAADPWVLLNVVATVTPLPFLLWWSPAAFAYLAASSFLAFGLHPVGIRRYAEHVAVRRGQPTNSYYGMWNLLALNVGHHVEHHDFPGIPWSRLPELRRLAPERYDTLVAVRSYSRLLLALLFDPRYPVDRYVAAAEDEGDGTIVQRPAPGLASAR